MQYLTGKGVPIFIMAANMQLDRLPPPYIHAQPTTPGRYYLNHGGVLGKPVGGIVARRHFPCGGHLPRTEPAGARAARQHHRPLRALRLAGAASSHHPDAPPQDRTQAADRNAYKTDNKHAARVLSCSSGGGAVAAAIEEGSGPGSPRPRGDLGQDRPRAPHPAGRRARRACGGVRRLPRWVPPGRDRAGTRSAARRHTIHKVDNPMDSPPDSRPRGGGGDAGRGGDGGAA